MTLDTLYYKEAKTKNKDMCAFFPKEEPYRIKPNKNFTGAHHYPTYHRA